MENRSIHPRVVGGRTVHEKVNTAEPSKGRAHKLDAKRARLGARRLARADTIKTVKNVKPEAFRVPGSMNQHKR